MSTLLADLTRGGISESRHFGAIAVVDPDARIIASVGDPEMMYFLRSSSKPMQTVALVESGAADHYGLTEREIAQMCASHSGEDFHVAAVRAVLAKAGLDESYLRCGTHWPSHAPTAQAMLARGEQPISVHCNCSGKHTGMLLTAKFHDHPLDNYDAREHPYQRRVLGIIHDFAGTNDETIVLGVDGCGVPVFGMTLHQAATAYARLANPNRFDKNRRDAVHRITQAMRTYPEMVAGTDRMDTSLMRAAHGNVFSKGGAEGGQCLGIPGLNLGIAIKVEDGNPRAMPQIVAALLRQIGALDEAALAEFMSHHSCDVTNFRKDVVGEIRTAFEVPRAAV